MLEAFSAYIKNIAIFMLFAAFAQLLMPENNFKKYLNFVMGLLLLTAVLKPILSIAGTDLELETIQKAVSVWSKEYEYNEGQKQWNDEMILDIYKRELEQKWTEELQYKFHTNAEVQTEIAKNGEILSVSILGECEKGEEMKKYMKEKYNIEEILTEGS